MVEKKKESGCSGLVGFVVFVVLVGNCFSIRSKLFPPEPTYAERKAALEYEIDLAKSDPKEVEKIKVSIAALDAVEKKRIEGLVRKAQLAKEQDARRTALLLQHGLVDENQYLTRGVRYVATTKAALQRLEQVARAGDSFGIVELLGAGLLFSVDDDTRVRVISRDWDGYEVRIETGDRAPRSGWVASQRLWRP